MRSWTGPALALALLASGGATAQQTREPLTPEDARPPADLLTSCEGDNAPPALPDALSGWATIYCTKQGHMFSPNDRHVGTFPGSGQRGVLYAAMLDGATAPGPNDSRFAKVTYDPLSEDDIRKVSEGATGAMGKILAGARYRITLHTAKGGEGALIATDTADLPFWVVRLRDGKPSGGAFSVTTLDRLNDKAKEAARP
jgi:hypothetical protein